jgi:hypothetical protein
LSAVPFQIAQAAFVDFSDSHESVDVLPILFRGGPEFLYGSRQLLQSLHNLIEAFPVLPIIVQVDLDQHIEIAFDAFESLFYCHTFLSSLCRPVVDALTLKLPPPRYLVK